MKAQIDSLAVAALVIALATGGFTMALVTGNLAMALAADRIEVTQRNACNLRLDVELSPALPNAQGGRVLGSLLQDPLFPLTFACPTDRGILVEVASRGSVYHAGTR